MSPAFINGVEKHFPEAQLTFDKFHVLTINNGILEGINSLIQAAKAKARGYRITKNLITMIYLIGGKLEFRLST
ncbi:MAG: transposase [Proteobacteria bacterium]|nr:transposase [Pseudomonadota bacterium]MBU4370274.1 transposase [Pseudomonadota bacterium]MBU4580894.1 transposase [Pseudomonadota bacterium]